LIAALGSAAVFCAIHALNYYHYVAPIYRRVPAGSPMAQTGLTWDMVAYGMRSFALYTGFTLAGITIAAKTKDRFLWMLPPVLFVLSPLPGMLILQDRPALRPILDPYEIPGSGPGLWRWIFAVGDLVLVLLPGAIVAFRAAARRPRVDRHARLAFVACATLVVLLYLRQQYMANNSFDVNIQAHLMLAILFIVGASLGTKRPWFPVVHLVVAFCLSDAFMVVPEWIHPTWVKGLSSGGLLHLTWRMFLPALMAVSLGALSDPLAGYLRHRRETPLVGAAQPA
jgi:hypothetical protein